MSVCSGAGGSCLYHSMMLIREAALPLDLWCYLCLGCLHLSEVCLICGGRCLRLGDCTMRAGKSEPSRVGAGAAGPFLSDGRTAAGGAGPVNVQCAVASVTERWL